MSGTYISIVATKPGTPPPRVDKRTADSKIFQLDCTSLLSSANELVYGKVSVKSPVLKITELEPKLGKYVRFRVEGGPLDIPYEDYLIIFTVHTSSNNDLSVPITIRAYSV
jgi:hypothetical protein